MVVKTIFLNVPPYDLGPKVRTRIHLIPVPNGTLAQVYSPIILKERRKK